MYLLFFYFIILYDLCNLKQIMELKKIHRILLYKKFLNNQMLVKKIFLIESSRYAMHERKNKPENTRVIIIFLIHQTCLKL